MLFTCFFGVAVGPFLVLVSKSKMESLPDTMPIFPDATACLSIPICSARSWLTFEMFGCVCSTESAFLPAIHILSIFALLLVLASRCSMF